MRFFLTHASPSWGLIVRRALRYAAGRRRPFALLGALLTGLLAGCKDLTGAQTLPAGTPNPSVYDNAAGAIEMRNAAVWQLEFSIPDYLSSSGLLTDELTDTLTGASAGVLLTTGSIDLLDERTFPQNAQGVNDLDTYSNLQQTRAYISQALGALAQYGMAPADSAATNVRRGEMYAFLGYTEILLADLYCSGVPLSVLNYHANTSFTYAPSSTTSQVYDDAIAKLDTALMLGGGSDSVLSLARVLKGRAELALGQYQTAAEDVSTVPDTFVYVVYQVYSGNTRSNGDYFISSRTMMSNDEGTNGLDFLSSGDPRSAGIGVSFSSTTHDSLFAPAKYQAGLTTGYARFVVASGVEARLIQAEAALSGVATGTGSWLDQLNALRTNGQNITRMSNQTYTGPGLPQLTDPGATLNGPAATAARVALLFRERAFWLYQDGHRQGDLRRLLRQYSALYPGGQAQVYPTGPYFAPGTGTYGSDVTVPIEGESANPLFHGCLDRAP